MHDSTDSEIEHQDDGKANGDSSTAMNELSRLEELLRREPGESHPVADASAYLSYLTGAVSAESSLQFERALIEQPTMRGRLRIARDFVKVKQQNASVQTVVVSPTAPADEEFVSALEAAWERTGSLHTPSKSEVMLYWNSLGYETIKAQAALGVATAATALSEFRQFGSQLLGRMNRPQIAWSRGEDGEANPDLAISGLCHVALAEITVDGDLAIHLDTYSSAANMPPTADVSRIAIYLQPGEGSTSDETNEEWQVAVIDMEALPFVATVQGIGRILNMSRCQLPLDCIRIALDS